MAAERVLSQRELNRAVLARQLLLKRVRLPISRALERMAGVQAQYAPSTYVRLWSCLDGFARDDLTRALDRRRVVTATLMRSTIHVVSAGDYWLFSAGVGPSRGAWWLRTHGKDTTAGDLARAGKKLRRALAGGTRTRAEVDALLRSHGSTIWNGAWVELVRVPPSGTWERRRADLFQLAAEWLPAEDRTEADGLEHLLVRHLQGFGPASLADAANWAGVPTTKLKEVAERLELRRYRDETGKVLVDLPRGPLPPASTPAPARFLPTWDAALLAHARRAQILPERFRARIFNTKMPQSAAVFLLDGAVAGTWRVERTAAKATVVLEPFERLPRNAADEVRDEGTRLARFYEPDATSSTVRTLRPAG